MFTFVNAPQKRIAESKMFVETSEKVFCSIHISVDNC